MNRILVGASLVFLTTALAAQPFGGPGGFSRGGGQLVVPAEVSERVFTTTVTGRLEPVNTVPHSASVGGVVLQVNVRMGDEVEPGAPLYSVERSDTSGRYAPVVVAARIAGTVSAVSVRPQLEIRSGETGVTIIDTTSFSLTTMISDKDAFRVRIGGPVRGTTPSGAEVRGTLLARSPEPDYDTGLYTLLFRISGGAGALPGQFVTIDLPVETVRGIFVDQNLLFRRYGTYYLWTVDENDTLRAREVSIGRIHDSDVEVISGLNPGDRLLARRRGNEREGAPVGNPEG